MYIHFTDAVHALLMPVTHPTVRVRRLQDLGHLPLLTGRSDPVQTPPHVRMVYECCACFADACCTTHSPRTASLGPWTPPPPRRLVQTRNDPHPCTYILQMPYMLC
jgi:hypothetical protein